MYIWKPLNKVNFCLIFEVSFCSEGTDSWRDRPWLTGVLSNWEIAEIVFFSLLILIFCLYCWCGRNTDNDGVVVDTKEKIKDAEEKCRKHYAKRKMKGDEETMKLIEN